MRWLGIRKRIVPWCMRPGCWHHSYVQPKHGRGNLCAQHFWEALEGALAAQHDDGGDHD